MLPKARKRGRKRRQMRFSKCGPCTSSIEVLVTFTVLDPSPGPLSQKLWDCAQKSVFSGDRGRLQLEDHGAGE